MFAQQAKGFFVLALLTVWAGAGVALAAPVTWDGGTGANGNWTTGANWDADAAPIPGADNLIFAGTNNLVTNNNFAADSVFTGIDFDSTAGAFTLGGARVTLGGNILNSSSSAQQISLPLLLNGDRTADGGAAGLTLGGITENSAAAPARQLTLLGNGTLNGVLSNQNAGGALRVRVGIIASADPSRNTDTWSVLGNSVSSYFGQLDVAQGILNFGSGADSPSVTLTRNAVGVIGDNMVVGQGGVGIEATFNMKSGSYTLNAGGFNDTRIVLGNTAGMTPTWNQTGGTVTLQNFVNGGTPGVYNANQGTTNANFNISGGLFDTGGAPFNVSVRGFGVLNLTGGILRSPGMGTNANAAYLGITVADDRFANMTGTVNLNTGGTLEAAAIRMSRNLGGTAATASFNFNGGTLKALATNPAFMIHSNNPGGNDTSTVVVQAGGAIIDTNGFNVGIALPLLGGADGGLRKKGVGTLTLNGNDSTYDGLTVVEAGTLAVGNTSGSGTGLGNIEVNSGATLGGTGSVGGAVLVKNGGKLAGGGGTLTLNGTTTLGSAAADGVAIDIQPNAVPLTPAINATGGLTVNAGVDKVLINITGPTAVGTYRLVDYNALTGSFSSFELGTVAARAIASLVDNAGNTSIDLSVTGTDRAKWTGALGSEWSTATLAPPKNWQLVTAGTTTDYVNGDNPLFDDSATGTTTADVSVADVTPIAVEFNNPTKSYTINGTKSILSSGGLTKAGAAGVVINANSTFGGSANVSGGSVTINGSTSFGGTASVTAGGTLSFRGATTVTGAVNVAAGTTLEVGGGGATGSLTAASVENAGVLRFNRSGSLSFNTLINGTGEVRKEGTGSVAVSGLNTYTGVTNVQGGTLVASNNNSVGDLVTPGAVNVLSGATFDVGGFSASNSANFGQKQFNIIGSGAAGVGALINSNPLMNQQNAFQRVALTGNATIGGPTRFDIRGGPPVLDLADFTLTKSGASEIRIVGATIENGSLGVEEGTLTLEGTITDNFTTGKLFANNGGRLALVGQTGGITRPMEINGGVLHGNGATNTLGSPIQLKGTATFSLQAGSQTLTLSGNISDDGTPRGIIVQGVDATNSVVANGTNTYTGNTIVNVGILSIAPTSTTSDLANGADVFVATGAVLDLGFTNTDTVRALFLGGVAMAAGIYGPLGSGAPNETAFLTGASGGFLNVMAKGLLGDYNKNNVVDAADYVQWRNNVGTHVSLANDPTGGLIGTAQYNTWRSNFGATAPGSGSGEGQLVPEPGSAALGLLLVFVVASIARRRSKH